MPKPKLEPIHKSQREPIVDILRGWALLGVVLVNFSLFFYLDKNEGIPKGDVLSSVAKLINQLLFENKSRLMLNILFGFGFSVLIEKFRSRDQNVWFMFSKRMLILLALATINSCFYYGDFLKDYFVMGMCLLPFYSADAKWSLRLVIALLLIVPFIEGTVNPQLYSYLSQQHWIYTKPNIELFQSHHLIDVIHYGLQTGLSDFLSICKFISPNMIVLACFFLGMYVHKKGLLKAMVREPRVLRWMFLASLFAMIAMGLVYVTEASVGVRITHRYNIESWLNICHVALLTTLLCWGSGLRFMEPIFDSFQAIGQMTLTNYMVQNLLSLLIFSGFGLGLLYQVDYFSHLAIAIGIYLAQVLFSRWWLSRFDFGPVEWLWRKLSYS